jgi:hypothetical protein
VQHQWDTDEFPTTQRTTNDPSPAAWIVERKVPLRGVLRPHVQSLQYVLTIAAPIKSRRLGKPTVQNLRQPDQRLKIKLGPFGHHAVEYLAAMPSPRAIKTGKKFFSEFLV